MDVSRDGLTMDQKYNPNNIIFEFVLQTVHEPTVTWAAQVRQGTKFHGAWPKPSPTPGWLRAGTGPMPNFNPTAAGNSPPLPPAEPLQPGSPTFSEKELAIAEQEDGSDYSFDSLDLNDPSIIAALGPGTITPPNRPASAQSQGSPGGLRRVNSSPNMRPANVAGPSNSMAGNVAGSSGPPRTPSPQIGDKRMRIAQGDTPIQGAPPTRGRANSLSSPLLPQGFVGSTTPPNLAGVAPMDISPTLAGVDGAAAGRKLVPLPYRAKPLQFGGPLPPLPPWPPGPGKGPPGPGQGPPPPPGVGARRRKRNVRVKARSSV